MAQSAPDMSLLSPVPNVSRSAKGRWTDSVSQRWLTAVPHGLADQRSPHVVVIDCGVKHNVLRHLRGLGARVTVVPDDATPESIMVEQPDGVVISNGPGDPEQVPKTIATVRALMGQVPILGICLGHQIIGLAAGALKYKLPFGHHGGNHPVHELSSGRVEITAQNHNYAIDADSLKGLPFVVTHINLYDGTVEGLRHVRWPVFGVQYHPEASPGPHDSLHILRTFVRSIGE